MELCVNKQVGGALTGLSPVSVFKHKGAQLPYRSMELL